MPMVHGSMKRDLTILFISGNECGLGAKRDEAADDAFRQSIAACEMDAILTIVVLNGNRRGIALGDREDNIFRDDNQSAA